MNPNFQPGIHPDADELSVFVEGAATAREHERMLAHLADCSECRKTVFLMQPQKETQATTEIPVKGWAWRRLLPVALPAAALACAVVAVLIHIRPRGGAPEAPQQNASLRQPEIQSPGTSAAPIASPDSVARLENPANGVPRNAPLPNLSRRKDAAAGRLNLPAAKSHQAAASVESRQTMAAAPVFPARGGAVGGVAGGIAGGVVAGRVGGGFGVQAAQTAASNNNSIEKKDLPASVAERTNDHEATLAGISGHITDRTGAVVAGATVALRDASGKTRQTTTGTDGSFHLTELPPGEYELTATASGFEARKQSIELKPNELAMLQPVLDPGAVAETVEVQGASPAIQAQTESANVSGTVTEKETTQTGLNGRNFSQLIALEPGTTTVSQGKRVLSLDSAGNLSLSHDRGKKWKKINPQWAGKAVRIELTSAYSSEAAPAAKNETGPASKGAIFQLTTDTGAVWTSKDGTHWHQQSLP